MPRVLERLLLRVHVTVVVLEEALLDVVRVAGPCLVEVERVVVHAPVVNIGALTSLRLPRYLLHVLPM